MLEPIQEMLTQIDEAYADRRLRYCGIELAEVTPDRVVLGGAVLDADTLVDVSARLRSGFPDLSFDLSSVRILRTPNLPEFALATNLTGLYSQPSFLSEQVSQLLNGARVEILMSEGRWTFVRQPDGYLGWVYLPYLAPAGSAHATHLICEPASLVRREVAADAPLLTRLFGGTGVSAVVSGAWAEVALAGDARGWIAAGDLRDLSSLPEIAETIRAQMLADAARYVGVPYMWGGCSGLGIDCSGFARLVHRLVGITLPRDADMQYAAGKPVEPPYRPGDLLFFGEEDSAAARKITHVGLSLGGWHIVHSSRSRNGVYADDVQAVAHLATSFAGARTFVPPDAA